MRRRITLVLAVVPVATVALTAAVALTAGPAAATQPSTTQPSADTQPPTRPGPPTWSDPAPTSITLHWGPSTDNVGVSGYEVILHAGKEEIGTFPTTDTSYAFTGLSPGQQYHAFVRARDLAGNWSAEAATLTVKLPWTDDDPPTPPGTPTISAVGSTGFTVSWAPSTDDHGVAGYEVWLESGGSMGEVARTTGTTAVITGKQPGTTYRVRVRAVDTGGQFSFYTPAVFVTTEPAAASCTASYRIVDQWQGGFLAEVTVRNGGTTPYSAWTVTWTFPAGQRVTNLWNARWTPDGATVTARNLSWNGGIAAGGSRSFGFLGTFPGTNPPPALTPTCAE